MDDYLQILIFHLKIYLYLFQQLCDKHSFNSADVVHGCLQKKKKLKNLQLCMQ